MKTIIQISSGRGPAECCLLVSKVLKKVLEETKGSAIVSTIISRHTGFQNGTLVSARVQLSGKEEDVAKFLSIWIGTVQWTVQSPYRKYHKRKNWFVGVSTIKCNEKQFSVENGGIRYEAIRSGGPGGQHVNKVSTAIRAVHIASGTQVLCTESRSQLLNKKRAKERLMKKLADNELQNEKENAGENWQQHNELNRGNPIRKYYGSIFNLEN